LNLIHTQKDIEQKKRQNKLLYSILLSTSDVCANKYRTVFHCKKSKEHERRNYDKKKQFSVLLLLFIDSVQGLRVESMQKYLSTGILQ